MSQTSLQRCYANSRAQINIFELKHKTPKANVYAALFVLEILLAAVQLKSSDVLIASGLEGRGAGARGQGFLHQRKPTGGGLPPAARAQVCESWAHLLPDLGDL